jgi:hypothetical protein
MTPEERVRLFLHAMAEWERRTYPAFPKASEEDMRGWVRELRDIYAAHLTETGRGPKNWGKKIHPTRDIPTNSSHPPQYDQEIVRTEPTKKKNIVLVVTKSRWNPMNAYRFKVITGEDGVPFIEEQRYCLIIEGKMTEQWKTCLH